ncbi:MAG: tubulin-like doman-containing protein [Armatimonadetes bacterium]|nr:tubulin-like doman-containing protein [Armatimonadota bacterium]
MTFVPTAPGGAINPQDQKYQGVTKSIIIGLGGTGKEVVLNVRRRIVEKYGSLRNLPIVSFLVLDTDSAVLARVVEDETLASPIDLKPSEALHTAVTGVDTNLRPNVHHYPHIESWLDTNALLGDIAAGAGAVRARGRLAFFWNYQEIVHRFQNCFNQISSDSATQFCLSQGIRVVQGTNVYIVCSLLGGTGSGMFLDMAYTARQILRSQPIVDIVGILTVPPGIVGGDVDRRSNAYAAFRELNHYSANETEFSAQYSANEAPATDQNPPFDFCYLLGRSNGVSYFGKINQLFEMVGHNIFLDFTSEFAGQKKSNRDNIQRFTEFPDQQGSPQRFMSFGLSAIYFPKEKVTNVLANRLAARVVDGWLTPTRPFPQIDSFTADLLGQNQLSKEAVMDALIDSGGGNSLKGLVQEWARGVNRTLEQTYPGHNRVASYLRNQDSDLSSRLADTHPDETQWGQYLRTIQSNLRNLLRIKEESLRQIVVGMVNNEALRHSFARQFLGEVKRNFELAITQLDQAYQNEYQPNDLPLAQQKDRPFSEMERLPRDLALKLVGGVGRALDRERENFLKAAARYYHNKIDMHSCVYAKRFFQAMGPVVDKLLMELDRYIRLVEGLRDEFSGDEAIFRHMSVDINGEVLYEDAYTDRFFTSLVSESTRNDVGTASLQKLNVTGDIFRLKDLERADIKNAIFWQARSVFAAPMDRQSVLDLFFERYPRGQVAEEHFGLVYDRSQPFLVFSRGLSGYVDDPGKRDTIVGVAHGNSPTTASEREFVTTVQNRAANVTLQNFVEIADSHQVLITREEGAFPLRMIADLPSYEAAYRSHYDQGNQYPLHARRDVNWLKIDRPPQPELDLSRMAFAAAWATGIVSDVKDARKRTVYQCTYVRKGLPVDRTLGDDYEEIILLLSDDKELRADLLKNVQKKREELGAEALTKTILEHAKAQRSQGFAFYDEYRQAIERYMDREGLTDYVEG